jgi:hypothetical protein
MILWLIFGFYINRPTAGAGFGFGIGNHLLVWVLLALLGWHSFGAALHQ